MAGTDHLNVARKLWRRFGLVKKQWFTNTIQLRNRCPLRENKFHLPAAYPRTDLASLILTDPNVFGSQGGCLWYTTDASFYKGAWTPQPLPGRVIASVHIGGLTSGEARCSLAPCRLGSNVI